jgi:hypothetical protein
MDKILFPRMRGYKYQRYLGWIRIYVALRIWQSLFNNSEKHLNGWEKLCSKDSIACTI